MSILNEFFKDIADMRDYVSLVGSDLEFQELNSSAISARKEIRNIISPAIWDKLKDSDDSGPLTFLKVAFGNLTMHKALIFTMIAKRLSGGADVYKYEIETMRRQYIDNYFNAMDSLIELLGSDERYKDDWMKLPSCKMIATLQVKSTSEMNSYYGIDMSYLFFFRTIPIQREVLDEKMSGYFQRASGRPELLPRLKRALVLEIVATALLRFDIIELPHTIRSLFDDQKVSRSGNTEKTSLENLAGSLQQQASGIILAVEAALAEPSSGNIDSETSFNRESDKFFLMS